MSDDEKPPEKPTVKFEAPPKWAQDGFERVHSGIAGMEARVNTRLDDQDKKLDHCISGLKTLNSEMEDLKKDHHEFKGATNARFDAGSMRVKAITLRDDEQDKKLSEMTESQVTKLVRDAAKTPLGQKVIQAIVGLVLLATAMGYAWLQTHGGAK